MLPHTSHAIRRAILLDLRVGQSTADSTAGRINFDTATVERALTLLLADSLVETLLIADRLTVYRATAKGLQSLI